MISAGTNNDEQPIPPGTTAQYVSVACVMLAVFLHLLGFTVTGPITPSLVSHFGLHPSQVGYLTSAYPLGMFFALFAWLELIGRDDDHGLGLLESVEVGDWRRRFLLALVLLSLGLGAILLGSLFDAVERGTCGVRDGGSMDRWF